MVQQEAVVVRNAVKSYGKGQLVLDGLNMTVSRGSIYGLLGASGCGKTTLLSCVVGVRHLDSGEVWVLGGNPGGKGSGIPGPQVGYMPQDISLVGEFTMSGALYYFGRINGLDDEEIETRQRFFSELLQLPPPDRMVKNMSGGQQRRVSFAAALIHSPELLILDEPTVGLDPILRENIWAYLIEITQTEGITVLITTHYIEETKDASKIGLMRCGKLLAESSPQKLLEQFQCSFLEEAFLKLCEAQNDAIILNKTQQSKPEDTGSELMNQDQNKYEQTKGISEYKTVSRRKVSRSKRFKALLAKNGVQFFRYYTGLIFAIVFPILQVAVFLGGIGQDPKDLKIGIVNDEASNCDYGSNLGNIWNDEITCHFGNLSCRFLHNFDDSIAIKKYYDNVLEASHDVQNGELVGIIHFSQNFSEALQIRVEISNFAKDSDLLASQIQVFLDMGDRQIGLITQKKLFDHFLEVYEDIMRDCKYSPKLGTPPIRFEDPIYGTTDLNYADYMTPPYILILVFFLATTISTTLIITERLEGVWDRSVVQGVRTEEIVLSHIVIQSFIIIIHTIMILLLFFPIWGLECKGSIFVTTVLIFLNGFSGLMYGFIISVACKNHTMAHYCSAGSFFPLIILNGALWPLEGMPKMLRWLSYALPTTLSSVSLRGLIYKGSSITDSEVYFGFLITLGWILLYLIVTLLGVRSKSS
ncbi:ABC transporter G family member 20-like isoform X2 [Temnothorax curvispinosus]|nr:ABC transporter G family member 20-like isoform X2 [Temnothorax curvispinosus]XP_024879605.1 ABC transporter G family member 20-like isoform X2 [Temnothorax curvispinosus]XP_024879606.1 ABC transporter G family member 20-like isoform X2 [Temnothorax curvispinosus]XP_024879607.1 ABC transporter G family member 20-like isoform X2 [Temnothorax curvispinosus]XP_024879608.1 ABC transporter G family member 20-like isoform X2 [Temnothorax curvispinosus]